MNHAGDEYVSIHYTVSNVTVKSYIFRTVSNMILTAVQVRLRERLSVLRISAKLAATQDDYTRRLR
jgi:hypothetical protein